MINIQSERLCLTPLSLHQLQLLSEGRQLMETSMGLQHSVFELSSGESFQQEFEDSLHNYIIPHVLANPEQYEWFTHWLIIEKVSNICIGGLGCNGLPDDNGQVMIGYYIDKKSEGLGYATEAVGSFVKWLFENPSLKMVIADTPMDHVASQKVLGNNGFMLLGEVEEGFRWQLERRESNCKNPS